MVVFGLIINIFLIGNTQQEDVTKEHKKAIGCGHTQKTAEK